MLYINKSKKEQVVIINGEGKKIAPNEKVDLNSRDLKFLPGTSPVIPFDKAQAQAEKVLQRRKLRHIRKERWRRRKAARQELAKKSKKAKKVVEKVAKKRKGITSIIKKAVKKVTKKAVKKTVKKTVDNKKVRAELKKRLLEMTKVELTDLANDQLGLELKSRAKKDDLIGSILKASLKIGYGKVLKKV